MKSLSVLCLFGTSLLAQGVNFTTGQAARLVIGQTTFTSQDANSSDVILGAASGLAFAADTLFVADSNRVGATPSNNRVLLYKGASSMFPSPTAVFTASQKCPVCVGKASVVVGQPDFTTATLNVTANANSLRLPTAVASDGIHLVVADTDHNRVLIWNKIPSVNNQAADVVVGQPNFSSVSPSTNSPTAKTLRGPQGVWILNGKLYIADTGDNRVLIFNRIPTSNGAAADVVLGAPNFTTFVEPDLTQQKTSAAPNNMLNPVAVSSDGVRLFVTDLGYNRVLVWNTIPTSNGAGADFALGQPNLNSSIPDYGFSTDPADTTHKETPVLCPTSIGTDTNNNPTYNARCTATLNFPRFALSTGDRLFIADGGADRVLVYNSIPNASGTPADFVIGQIGGSVNQASDAADSLRTPMSMAWDGVNLYVSDAYNRRITVYSLGANTVPYQGVRNAASLNIIATGQVFIGGTITAKDIVTITIAGTNYTYTVVANDTISNVVQGLVNAINTSNSGSGDPNVTASVDTTATTVVLTAKTAGADGNTVTYSATISTNATETATAAGANLSGGADSAKIAAGTIVQIQGANLSAQTVSADTSKPTLPTKLGGTQVYFNGIPAALYYVSPKQINAQVPWDFGFDLDPNDPNSTTSINAYVRSEMADGSVMVTTPVAVTIVTANPGVFTQGDPANAQAVAMHGSSSANGIISVDGTVTANDVATVTIEDRSYSYTVQSGDTLDTIRDNLVAQINSDPKVTAQAAGVFDRIIIKARLEGPEGNGIAIGGSTSSGATVIITPITSNGTLCCANVAGSLITSQNPAVPGEIINVIATGLGLPVNSGDVGNQLQNGVAWPNGQPETVPQISVSAIAGGKTADVLSATLVPGSVGTYLVVLHLNGDIPADSGTVVTIAQNTFTSNAVKIPVVDVATAAAAATTAAAAANTRRSDAPARALTKAPSAPSRLRQPRGSVHQ